MANRLGRALASFSTSKLDNIISSIEKNANRISTLVGVVQERMRRGDREDAAEERRLAGIARDEQCEFYKLHAEELRIRNLERKSMDDYVHLLLNHTS